MAQAADDPSFIARTDLAHVDADMQLRGKGPHEIAEIDAVLGFEVEHRFIAVEKVFDRDRAHVLGGLSRQLLEKRQGFGGLALQVGMEGAVVLRRDALNRLQRAFQLLHLLGRRLEHGIGKRAELGAARGLHHHVVPGGDFHLTGVEPQRFGVVRQINGGDTGHCAPHLPIFRARSAERAAGA